MLRVHSFVNLFKRASEVSTPLVAGIAQLVEQWTENPRVGGSSPPPGIADIIIGVCGSGSLPEWLMGADCKSAGYAYVGSNPTRPTTFLFLPS